MEKTNTVIKVKPEFIQKAYNSLSKEFKEELIQRKSELEELEISTIKKNMKNRIYEMSKEEDKIQSSNIEEIDNYILKHEELEKEIRLISNRIKLLKERKTEIME